MPLPAALTRFLRHWLRIGALLVAAVGLAGIAPPVRAVALPPFEFGEAPRRDESQDIAGWVTGLAPKAAPTRAQVALLYTTQYEPGAAAVLNWTGSLAGCVVGTTNIEHQQAVITRINYYRTLVDLPGVTLLGGVTVGQVQAAALMMTANNQLSHTPPISWVCYSADGAAGAGASNIAIGRNGVGAIDLYMDDSGPSNSAVGHRRWILHPPRAGMSTGDTTGNTANRPANALYVFGPTAARPATPNGIAWPPAGFVPYQNLPAMSNRWSLSFPGADFSNATVTMSGPGGAIAVSREPLASGFGDNTLVFLPAGISYGKPTADTTYSITVGNLAGTGVPPSIQYTVTVIDPAGAPAPAATAIAVEYYNAMLDHYFLTHIAGEIAILDAGVTIRGWVRTGQTITVLTAAGAGTSPVCRYYIPPGKGDSHFYGRGTAECNATGQNNPSFVNEDPQFFHVTLPVAGVCPAGTTVVYRVFSNRADANHRYMVSRALRDQMVAAGWLAEGDGPDLVVMCAPV